MLGGVHAACLLCRASPTVDEMHWWCEPSWVSECTRSSVSENCRLRPTANSTNFNWPRVKNDVCAHIHTCVGISTRTAWLIEWKRCTQSWIAMIDNKENICCARRSVEENCFIERPISQANRQSSAEPTFISQNIKPIFNFYQSSWMSSGNGRVRIKLIGSPQFHSIYVCVCVCVPNGRKTTASAQNGTHRMYEMAHGELMFTFRFVFVLNFYFFVLAVAGVASPRKTTYVRRTRATQRAVFAETNFPRR